MLRLTLEMVPFGQEEKKRTIGMLEVSNIGVNENVADYRAVFTKGNLSVTSWVKGFQRSKGAWALVKKALQANKDLQA
jgi:hypothetical protein